MEHTFMRKLGQVDTFEIFPKFLRTCAFAFFALIKVKVIQVEKNHVD